MVCLLFIYSTPPPPFMLAWKSLGSRPPTDNCLVKKNGKLDFFFFIYNRSQGKVSLYAILKNDSEVHTSLHIYTFKGTVQITTFLIYKSQRAPKFRTFGGAFSEYYKYYLIACVFFKHIILNIFLSFECFLSNSKNRLQL
jgi:hypothetical protein